MANAIWMCAAHARQIDQNDGSRYPEALLRSFRDEHELRVASEHEGTPLFRVNGIRAIQTPIVRAGQHLYLGKVTLLAGGNGTGKSSVVNWLSWLDASYSKRDDGGTPDRATLSFQVDVSVPSQHHIRVDRFLDRIVYALDGEEQLECPIPLEVIDFDNRGWYLSLESLLRRRREAAGVRWREELDDVEILARALDLNPLLVPGMLAFVGRVIQRNFVHLRVDYPEGTRHVVGHDTRRGREVSIHEASGSMLSNLVVDIAVARLNHLARSRPCLLVLNLDALGWDASRLALHVDYFASPMCQFQTIFTSVDTRLLALPSTLAWSRVHMSGHAPYCNVETLDHNSAAEPTR